MKPEIHPRYYNDAKVVCSCGNTWTTGSTQPELRVELCSTCHPFFTGQQRIVDSAGQVERFHRRFGLAGEAAGEEDGEAAEVEANEATASAS
ncbi:MAG: 50S ribosomal protein L31 [Dehalococcoidia bacterium]|nr:50S ribosomal protein L31 [Dehalococcoidia bacterium]